MNSIVLYTLKRVESGGWKTSEKEVVIIEARSNKKKSTDYRCKLACKFCEEKP